MTTVRPNSRISPKTYPTSDDSAIIRGEVNFNSPGVAAGATTNIRIGRLPVGAEIMSVKYRVVTAFVGPATVTVSAGTNSTTFDNIFAATDGKTVAGSVTAAAAGLALATDAAELDVFMQVICGAGAPTAGKARIFIETTTPVLT
jgi:hypothetical protein